MRIINAIRNSAILQCTKRSRKFPSCSDRIPFNNRYFLPYVWTTPNICNPISVTKSAGRLKNIQLDLHQDFINVVEKSRGAKLNKTEVELFSGEFWSGSRAKKLGLIDGIGDAHDILKEKFGEDVVIKKFEKTKGWLSQKLSSSNHIDQFANILDERSIWQRYGF